MVSPQINPTQVKMLLGATARTRHRPDDPLPQGRAATGAIGSHLHLPWSRGRFRLDRSGRIDRPETSLPSPAPASRYHVIAGRPVVQNHLLAVQVPAAKLAFNRRGLATRFWRGFRYTVASAGSFTTQARLFLFACVGRKTKPTIPQPQVWRAPTPTSELPHTSNRGDGNPYQRMKREKLSCIPQMRRRRLVLPLLTVSLTSTPGRCFGERIEIMPICRLRQWRFDARL
jgi:hypothetical protein